jgi:hypothetical protein
VLGFELLALILAQAELLENVAPLTPMLFARAWFSRGTGLNGGLDIRGLGKGQAGTGNQNQAQR